MAKGARNLEMIKILALTGPYNFVLSTTIALRDLGIPLIFIRHLPEENAPK
jgi:hypothetical protein